MVGRATVRLHEAALTEPSFSIFGVFVEPATRAAETKTVTPIIHVLHEPFHAGSGQLVRQHDLQVADGRLFEIVATRIAFEVGPSIPRHADDVAGLVKQGMNWRIASDKDPIAHNARFRLAPETAVYRLLVRNQFDREAVLSKPLSYRIERQIGN